MVASWTLLMSAGLTMASAVAYLYAGRRLSRRNVPGPGRLSWHLFLTWWYAVAALAAVSAVTYALAALGNRDIVLFIVVQMVSYLLLCVGNLGLVYYLVTLFTGKWGAWKPLALFYLGYYLLLLYDLSAGKPQAVEVMRWRTDVAYQGGLSPSVATLIYSLLILPQILGAMAYMVFFVRIPSRSGRWRVTIVGSSILGWSLVSVAIAMSLLPGHDVFQAALRLVGLAIPFLLVCAYYPPRWVQERWRITPVEEVTSS